jgi:hypothetical protein
MFWIIGRFSCDQLTKKHESHIIKQYELIRRSVTAG